MDKRKQQVIDSFVRSSTTYAIEVRDNSMLPKELKGKKELSFTVRPPTVHVLSLAASVLVDLPEPILSEEGMELKEALKYQDRIVRVLSIYFHEEMDYPEWYPDFLLKNLASVELLHIMQETAIKCNPGFFLNSFQVAGQGNPMMMLERKKTQDSTSLGS